MPVTPWGEKGKDLMLLLLHLGCMDRSSGWILDSHLD